MSTSGRAPVFRATIRFWISVDSLNRPPTLCTIPSSFRSSSIAGPLELLGDDPAQFGHGRVQVVVGDLILIPRGVGEFRPRRLQPAAGGRIVLRAAGPQPLLVRF